jgi:hypothetical protein
MIAQVSFTHASSTCRAVAGTRLWLFTYFVAVLNCRLVSNSSLLISSAKTIESIFALFDTFHVQVVLRRTKQNRRCVNPLHSIYVYRGDVVLSKTCIIHSYTAHCTALTKKALTLQTPRPRKKTDKPC